MSKHKCLVFINKDTWCIYEKWAYTSGLIFRADFSSLPASTPVVKGFENVSEKVRRELLSECGITVPYDNMEIEKFLILVAKLKSVTVTTVKSLI